MRFGDTKLIAAESFHFNPESADPILQRPVATGEVDIVIGGHIYGGFLMAQGRAAVPLDGESVTTFVSD